MKKELLSLNLFNNKINNKAYFHSKIMSDLTDFNDIYQYNSINKLFQSPRKEVKFPFIRENKKVYILRSLYLICKDSLLIDKSKKNDDIYLLTKVEKYRLIKSPKIEDKSLLCDDLTSLIARAIKLIHVEENIQYKINIFDDNFYCIDSDIQLLNYIGKKIFFKITDFASKENCFFPNYLKENYKKDINNQLNCNPYNGFFVKKIHSHKKKSELNITDKEEDKNIINNMKNIYENCGDKILINIDDSLKNAKKFIINKNIILIQVHNNGIHLSNSPIDKVKKKSIERKKLISNEKQNIENQIKIENKNGKEINVNNLKKDIENEKESQVTLHKDNYSSGKSILRSTKPNKVPILLSSSIIQKCLDANKINNLKPKNERYIENELKTKTSEKSNNNKIEITDKRLINDLKIINYNCKPIGNSSNNNNINNKRKIIFQPENNIEQSKNNTIFNSPAKQNNFTSIFNSENINIDTKRNRSLSQTNITTKIDLYAEKTKIYNAEKEQSIFSSLDQNEIEHLKNYNSELDYIPSKIFPTRNIMIRSTQNFYRNNNKTSLKLLKGNLKIYDESLPNKNLHPTIKSANTSIMNKQYSCSNLLKNQDSYFDKNNLISNYNSKNTNVYFRDLSGNNTIIREKLLYSNSLSKSTKILTKKSSYNKKLYAIDISNLMNFNQTKQVDNLKTFLLSKTIFNSCTNKDINTINYKSKSITNKPEINYKNNKISSIYFDQFIYEYSNFVLFLRQIVLHDIHTLIPDEILQRLPDFICSLNYNSKFDNKFPFLICKKEFIFYVFVSYILCKNLLKSTSDFEYINSSVIFDNVLKKENEFNYTEIIRIINNLKREIEYVLKKPLELLIFLKTYKFKNENDYKINILFFQIFVLCSNFFSGQNEFSKKILILLDINFNKKELNYESFSQYYLYFKCTDLIDNEEKFKFIKKLLLLVEGKGIFKQNLDDNYNNLYINIRSILGINNKILDYFLHENEFKGVINSSVKHNKIEPIYNNLLNYFSNQK